VRIATLVRFALGGACLTAPAAVLAMVGGPDRGDADTRRVARVLGGRMVLQAVADVTLGRRTVRPGALVDVLHAVSMVPLAVSRPRHRRTAVASACLATGVGLLDLYGDTPGGTTAR
jgi:hypothetical protein